MSSSVKAKIMVVLLAAVSLYITVAFNACGEVAFEKPLSYSSKSTGGVIINNGDAFTSNKVVHLNLESGGRDLMIVSNDKNCKGEWQDYQGNMTWELAEENAETAVYVQYKDNSSDLSETICTLDTIIHDNVAPGVDFGSKSGDWLSSRDKNIKMKTWDALSGVKELLCLGETEFQACTEELKFSGLAEGSHTLKAKAIDNAGNESPVYTYVWNVDVSAPTVKLLSQPSLVSASINATFKYLAQDKISGIKNYECKLDNKAWTSCVTTQSYKNLSQGVHTFSVRAYDLAGNRSKVVSYKWTVDSQAPTVQITSGPKSLGNSQQASFRFKGLDNGKAITSFSCQIDGGTYVNCSSPKSYSGLAEGTHVFKVIGRDAAGNKSQPASYKWIVDRTKPLVRFVSQPNKLTNTTRANFKMSASDKYGVSTIECKLDTSAYQTCGTAKSLVNLAQGHHRFFIRARDKAGNLSVVKSYAWAIDSIKPVVKITSGAKALSNKNTEKFSFTVKDVGGVDRSECKVNGQAYRACTSPVSKGSLLNGKNIFYVKAIDKAGNVSAVVTHQWTKDNKGPVITFKKKPAAQLFVGDQAQIVFSIADSSGVASHKCFLNGKQRACSRDKQLSINLPLEGDFDFKVTAVDKAGNTSTANTKWSVSYELIDRISSLVVEEDAPVDILFVVDNSGSMDHEHKNIAQRISGFLSKLNGLDFKIAVTTANVNDQNAEGIDGRLMELYNLPGKYFITPETVNAQAVLGNTVKDTMRHRGNNIFYAIEQGIYTVYRTIERSLSADNSNESQLNKQFFRDEANFSVVLISDEGEAKLGGSNNASANTHVYKHHKNKAEELLDLVDQRWNGQKNFTFHSIITIPGDTACKAGHGYSYGYEYEKISKLTGAGEVGGSIIGSVCAADYAEQLKDIGQSVKDMQKTLSLECAPVDENNDGKPDLKMTRKLAGQNSYKAFNQAHSVAALKIVFSEFLAPGDYKINYKCRKK